MPIAHIDQSFNQCENGRVVTSNKVERGGQVESAAEFDASSIACPNG